MQEEVRLPLHHYGIALFSLDQRVKQKKIRKKCAPLMSWICLLGMKTCLPEEMSTHNKAARDKSKREEIEIAKIRLLFVIRQHLTAMKEGTIILQGFVE